MKFFKVNKLTNEKIVYGFFSRQGGFSKKPYDSLNCSYSSGDNKPLISQNISVAQEKLDLHNTKIKFIKQIHSNEIKIIDQNNFFNEIIADGIITQDKKICLAILTADCAPIFLYDRNNELICAIHSGWRGCLNNIISVAIKKFTKICKKPNDILAIIGPCLSQNNFEINENFKKKFLGTSLKYKNFFMQNNLHPKKSYFNMRKLIEFQLKEMSVNKIYHVNMDTYSEESLFFSHRRSTHADSLPTGRMINIIGFKQ